MAPSLRLLILGMIHSALDAAFLIAAALQAMMIAYWVSGGAPAPYSTYGSTPWLVASLLGAASVAMTLSLMYQIGIWLRGVEADLEERVIGDRRRGLKRHGAPVRARAVTWA